MMMTRLVIRPGDLSREQQARAEAGEDMSAERASLSFITETQKAALSKADDIQIDGMLDEVLPPMPAATKLRINNMSNLGELPQIRSVTDLLLNGLPVLKNLPPDLGPLNRLRVWDCPLLEQESLPTAREVIYGGSSAIVEPISIPIRSRPLHSVGER